LTAAAAAGLASQYRRISMESLVYWAGMGLVFFLGAAIVPDLKRWRRLALALVTLAAAVALWGLVNWLLDVRQVWGMEIAAGRSGAHGTFVNRNHFAGYLTLLFPFGVVLFLNARTLPGKIALAVANCIMVMGVVFALSRGAWLGLLAGAGVMAALLLDRTSRRGQMFWLGVLLFVIVAAVLVQMGLEPVVWRLEQSSSDAQLASIGGRVAIWRSALAMFAAHPILGCGPGTFGWMFPLYRVPGANSQAWFAHSDYLQALAETGLAGALAVAAVLGLLAWTLLTGRNGARRQLKRGLYLATFCALTAALVEVSFDFHGHILAFSYTLAVLLGAAVANHPGEKARLPKLFFVPALALVPLAAWLGLANLKLEQSRLSSVFAQPDAATAALEVARRLDPDNAELHFEWAESWTVRARFGLDRAPAFEAAWRGYQEAIRALPAYAIAWLRAGMLAEAAAGLRDAPISGKAMAPVLGRMAAIERDFGHPGDSGLDPGRYYRRALELDPNNPYFHDIAAIYFLRQGDEAAAERHLERAVALLPDLGYHQPLKEYFGEAAFREMAGRGLQAALEWTTQPADIHLTLGLWALDAGRLDEAKARLGEVDRRGQTDDPRRTTLAAALALGEGRGDDAVAIWLSYCDAQRWSAEAAGQAAAFFGNAGRAGQRRQFMAVLSDRVATHPRLAPLAAGAAEAEGDVPAAIKAMEMYRRHFPDDAEAMIRLHRLYHRSGDPVRAEEALRRSLRLRPDDPALYLELARLLVAQDLVEQAIPELELARRQFPENSAVLELLAMLYERRGRFALAAETYERLSAMRPVDGALQLRVCRSYLLAGERDKARACYESLLRREPGNAAALRELAGLR
jgi:tetratricopeptide (TPR) repeat protein